MARFALIGADRIRDMLENTLAKNIAPPVLEAAQYAAAGVMRDAIEDAAPVGQAEYVYQYGSRTVRVKHPTAGQAKSSVIIYKRKSRSFTKGDVNLLVGFEKKKGYYAYWYEAGSEKQLAKPFMESAFTSAETAAMEAAAQTAFEKFTELWGK